MRRTGIALSLLTYAALLAYAVWVWPRLPERVPMKWDLNNHPVSYGPRELFVGIPLLVPLLPTCLFLGLSRRLPAMAGAALALNGMVLLVTHATICAVLPGMPLPVPINAAVFAALGGSLALTVLLWRAARKQPRT